MGFLHAIFATSCASTIISKLHKHKSYDPAIVQLKICNNYLLPTTVVLQLQLLVSYLVLNMQIPRSFKNSDADGRLAGQRPACLMSSAED